MPDYLVYRLKATTLTPLHIGSGRELLNEYDYAIRAKRTWRIDDAALLDAQPLDDPAAARRLASVPPGQLLRDEDFRPDSPFFRYVIQGTPRAEGEGAVLREQLKNAFDQVYLPGSSLKGALRSAVGWYAWEKLGLALDPNRLDRRREWAARELEREIFGRDPNHDLMRALQVSDSAPVGAERLAVINVRVMNRGGALGSPIELEAVRPETVFELTLKLDLALFSEWARRRGLELSRREALLDLPNVVARRSFERFQREAAWYAALPGGSRLAGFYQQVMQQWPDGNRMLIQTGWGTGWEDKTFGVRMKLPNSRALEEVINRYRLAKGRRSSNDPFPKSRRVVMLSNQDPSGSRQETPVRPLGWLLVEFEPLQPAQAGGAGWKPVRVERKPAAAPPPAPAPRQAAQAMPAPSEMSPRSEPSSTKPPLPQPPQEPRWIESFADLPKKGDRFIGTVFEVQKDGTVLLEVPGIDPDEKGVGVIRKSDAGGVIPLKDGADVRCEVIELTPDPLKKSVWLIYCRRLK